MAANMNRVMDFNKGRRMAFRIGVGSALAVVLVACGGGGGGDSEESLNLRAAFDRLAEGMNREDVVRLVGREPKEESSDGTMYWSDGQGETLDVDMSPDGIIYWARWDKLTVPSASLRKDFD